MELICERPVGPGHRAPKVSSHNVDVLRKETPMANEKKNKLDVDEIKSDDLEEASGGTCGTCDTCSGCSHSGCMGCGTTPPALDQIG